MLDKEQVVFAINVAVEGCRGDITRVDAGVWGGTVTAEGVVNGSLVGVVEGGHRGLF